MIRDELFNAHCQEALKADRDVTLEFQQDNARPHIAKRTEKSHEALTGKYGLNIMATLKGSSQTIRATMRERLHK